MAVDRQDLASIAYWKGERQPQRCYVAFCLLMSAIQDAFLGLKEKKSANLNWSATCSYYSLVHAGRLVTFLALGDYPTSHAKLRDLLDSAPRRRERRPQARNGFPFDWLREFSRETESQTPPREPTSPPARSCSELREALVTYLTEIGVEEAEQRLDRFGKILSAAAKLRNDSNYKALLIAHEYDHETVSKAFENLSSHMAKAAEFVLSFVIDVFNGFRRHDPDLEGSRDKYEAFLHDYVHVRITFAIRQKLGHSSDLEEKLQGTLARIETHSPGVGYDDFERPVLMVSFQGKQNLMQAFQGRIAGLARITEELGET